jgi:hypothetical protein
MAASNRVFVMRPYYESHDDIALTPDLGHDTIRSGANADALTRGSEKRHSLPAEAIIFMAPFARAVNPCRKYVIKIITYQLVIKLS